VANGVPPQGEKEIFAFECWIPNAPWGDVRETVNAASLGAAKVTYWRRVTDAWAEIPYTAVRVRKVGAPYSSPEFLLGVAYRGIPHARCGDRVSWGKTGRGVIVDFGGGGAWLQVLTDDAQRLYVHPAECHEYTTPSAGKER